MGSQQQTCEGPEGPYTIMPNKLESLLASSQALNYLPREQNRSWHRMALELRLSSISFYFLTDTKLYCALVGKSLELALSGLSALYTEIK